MSAEKVALTTTRTITCSPTDLTAGTLRLLLGDADDAARVRVTITPGDRPFDPGPTLSIRITEEP